MQNRQERAADGGAGGQHPRGAQRRVIAQTEFGQMHISALRSMLVTVREDYPDEILRDGDMVVTNDPFRGGVHPTAAGGLRRIHPTCVTKQTLAR